MSSVIAMAGARQAAAEAQDWAQFAEASSQAAADQSALVAFCGAWLALAARQVPQGRQALLLLAERSGAPYRAIAAWPDPQADLSAMGPLAEQALRERRGLAAPLGPGPASAGAPRPGQPARLAFPILPAPTDALGSSGIDPAPAERASGPAGTPEPAADATAADGALPLGVVVLDLADGQAALVQAGLRTLHWSSGWLIAQLQARDDTARQRALTGSRQLNALSALVLAQTRPEAAGLAVANQLAEWFGCSRVAIGLEVEGTVRPLALSHSAVFDPRSDTVRGLGRAMDEALDLGQALAHGGRADEAGHDNALVQAEVARRLGVAALASVPLRRGARGFGALTLERADGPGFGAAELDRLQQLADWVAPALAWQQAQARPLWRQAAERLAGALPAWRRPGRMAALGLAALLLAGAALVPMTHRVSARGQLEGERQRAVLAPFDGHLVEALVQAGDTVRRGQPLARLDDRELRLELARWEAERAQQAQRQQVALAQGDRAALGVAAAQVAQSEAMLALVRERLARATLVAPFDALVTQGDWRTQLGSAVEQGRLLFELAPPGGHRVVLRVDDGDIARLAAGQRGELVLAGLPQQAWPISVTRVTPVAATVDGRHQFRVEARLETADPRLKPGMEGVGKVVVGERSALWLASHGLADALRIGLWRWLP